MDAPFTIYITAQTIVSDLQHDEGRELAVKRLRDGGFRRVVLEAYRGGLIVEEFVLRELRDYFEAQGFETMGGLMPVYGEGFGRRGEGIEIRGPFFCYSSDDTVKALEFEIRKLARLFNEVVIDDAFLTACRCSRCRQGCRSGDWFSFRRALLCAVAEHFVNAAHEENPKVRLIVKFPQYYDRHHRFGYDAKRFPEIFDAVWIGTETRDPETLDYGYVEPYQGYVNIQWMRACAGAKFEGAWFDYLDCDDQLFYEQGVTTFLGAPRDVTVFCYGQGVFGGSKMKRLTDAVPKLEQLRAIAREPWGVEVFKPANSEGGRDLFIMDYLGMLGIPCVPVTELDPAARCVIVPAHGMEDPATPAHLAAILDHGGTVILTFDALWRIADRSELLDLFGYDVTGIAPATVEVDCLELGRERFRTGTPVRFAGDLAPISASILAWGSLTACERGTMRVPLLTVKRYSSGGKAVVWNIGTFGHDDFNVAEKLNVPVKTGLFGLPKAVLDALRATATEPLGFTVEALPRVACFLFAEHLVLVNYASGSREVRVEGLSIDTESLLTDSANTSCQGGEFLLAQRSFAAVKIRR